MYEYTYIIVIVHIVHQCIDILVLYLKYMYLLRKHTMKNFLYIFLVEGVGVHERGDQAPRSSCFGGLDTWMKRGWQTCKIIGVWSLKESKKNSSLHPLPREDSSMAKILETQRSNLLSIPHPLYSSPLLFLSSFSLSP